MDVNFSKTLPESSFEKFLILSLDLLLNNEIYEFDGRVFFYFVVMIL